MGDCHISKIHNRKSKNYRKNSRKICQFYHVARDCGNRYQNQRPQNDGI